MSEYMAVDFMCGHFTEENIRRNFFESSESEIFESAGRLAGLKGFTAPEMNKHIKEKEILEKYPKPQYYIVKENY